MDYKKKAMASFLGAVLAFVLAAVLLPSSYEAEEELRYYLDEDYRAGTKILSLIGWGAIIFGVIDIIQGVAFLMQENKQEGSSIGSTLINCPHCGNLISRGALKCPFCGKIPNTPVSGYTPRPVESISGTRETAQKLAGKKCVFCGKEMDKDQIFCGSCGRRQD